MKVKDGYKKTEIGVIPNDWELRKLEDVSYLIMGQSPIGSSYNKIGDGYALINGPTEFTKRSPVKIQWTSSPTKFCKNGDVLICVRGSSTGRINISNDEYCIGRGVAAIRAKERTNHSYLEFQINNAVKNILSLTAGSTFPNIDGKTLKQISIPLPSLPEQKTIAEVLSDTDNLIQSLEKRIAKKRLIKQGAMQKLLTAKDGWELKRLGEVCNYQNGTSLEKYFNNKEGLKVISIGNYSSNGKFIENKTFINRRYKSIISKFILEKHELTMLLNDKTSVGSIIGRVLLIDKNNEYVFNQRTMRLKPKDNILSFFLYYTINSDLIHKKIVQLAKPGTQIYVNTDDITQLEISFPKSKTEQTRIATILSDMDTEIETLEKKLAKYKQLKQGLMQNLLTGKIRLV